MVIQVIGSESQGSEVADKFGQSHVVRLTDTTQLLTDAEVVFDFLSVRRKWPLTAYRDHSLRGIFLDVTLTPLSQLMELPARSFGFCGLPSFLNRPVLEASVVKPGEENVLASTCAALNTDFRMVQDKVGMVTPRIICMIINEAFLTAEDGTATREDIDLAMKLGTNYPFGPFEWCRKIGAPAVVELLEALYRESNDPRYKVSDLLRREH